MPQTLDVEDLIDNFEEIISIFALDNFNSWHYWKSRECFFQDVFFHFKGAEHLWIWIIPVLLNTKYQSHTKQVPVWRSFDAEFKKTQTVIVVFS